MCVKPQSLLSIYNKMLRNHQNIYYPNCNFSAKDFNELSFVDIEKYFDKGGKASCLNEYYNSTNNGEVDRVKHMFSVYLLGIHCYDTIPRIKKHFDNFIGKRENDNSRNIFLYFWFLTALYHDMWYECEDDIEAIKKAPPFKNSFLEDHAETEIDCIPREIRESAMVYFEKCFYNGSFRPSRCIDHGFAAGNKMYLTMKEIHNQVENNTNGNNIFSPDIFNQYIIPIVWTIACHNIWLVKEGSVNGKKYRDIGLEKLIYQNSSPINCENHPLLFLLDFVDTIDPEKRFGIDSLNEISIVHNNHNNNSSFSLGYHGRIRKSPLFFKLFKDALKKLSKDLDFLKSSSFEVTLEIGGKCITFSFN